MSIYYISIKQKATQLYQVNNCKSKAEAIRKIKSRATPDVDAYGFEVDYTLWSTAKMDWKVDEEIEKIGNNET